MVIRVSGENSRGYGTEEWAVRWLIEVPSTGLGCRLRFNDGCAVFRAEGEWVRYVKGYVTLKR